MLYNINNHKAYIGETTNFKNRASTHRHSLRSGVHSNDKLQEDYDNNCEFAFVILEDLGNSCDRDTLLFREKDYILAFLKKRIAVYNKETKDQLVSHYFWRLLSPVMDDIYHDLRKQLGCEILTLRTCRPDTLRDKFEWINMQYNEDGKMTKDMLDIISNSTLADLLDALEVETDTEVIKAIKEEIKGRAQ